MSSDYGRTNIEFWKEKGDDLGVACHNVVQRLWTQQSMRREEFRIYACLYGDVGVMGVNPWGYGQLVATPDGPAVSSNIVRSIINTTGANVTQTKIRPMVLTSGGNYELRQRAKAMQKLADACFYTSGVHDLAPRILRDAMTFGTGFAYVYNKVGDNGMKLPHVDRVLPQEILIDDADGFYERPRTLARVRTMDRNVAKAMFPDKSQQLDDADRARDEQAYLVPSDHEADIIQIYEIWHLPSGPKAKDGLYVCGTGNIVLQKDAYDCPKFPIVRMVCEDAFAGFWGVGLARMLLGKQVAINRMLLNIQEAGDMISTPRIAMPNGSQIVDTEINDEIGGIVHCSGDAPAPLVWPAYSQDYYSHLRWIKQAAYEDEGVSQLDASAIKPGGLNSGEAQRVYADIVSKRVVDLHRRFDKFHMDIYHALIRCAKELAEEDGGDYEFIYRGDKELERIKWSDAAMGEDEYQITVMPASALPTEPGARYQRVEEWAQSGLISKGTEKRLLDFPDLEAESALDAAPYELVLRRLNLIALHGEYLAPEPFMDLQICLQLGGKFYQQMELEYLPEDRLEKIRLFIETAAQMMPSAPTAPPVGPPGMPPMGAPPGLPPGPPPMGPPGPPLPPPGLPPG